MAPPKQNLYKAHVTLDQTDLARLREIFGSTIGVSAAIRIAVRRFLTDHEALSRTLIDQGKPPPLHVYETEKNPLWPLGAKQEEQE